MEWTNFGHEGVPFPYSFIAIEGNIGAGKTSLCRTIAEHFGCRLVLEEFSDNPFLPLFYKNPERYAFSVELFFMSERYQQLQNTLINKDLFQKVTISDYFFLKTLLFAGNNLNDEENRLFRRLFNQLSASCPMPELLVYLYRPVPALLNNIRKRGRTYEQDITPEYLHNIQQAYLDYFKVTDNQRIVILHLDDLDFMADSTNYQRILNVLTSEHPIGVSQYHLLDRSTYGGTATQIL